MTLAQTFAAKALVAFVAIAMMLTAVAPAQAATSAELEAQIASLMATINGLQSQLGQSTVVVGVCPYAWTRSLSSGSTGADVMKLQQFLNASDDTRVAASGAGSAGMETQYYGPATAAAVSKFQVKYRADILTPAGLVNPTGYFGPSSMAKANAMCVATTPVDPGDDDDDTDSEDLQGEGTLGNFEIDEAADDEVQEGEEDAVIAELTMEATDGDIEVDRMDFTIAGFDTPSESDPWKVFEEITLWVDGEEIASFDASDEDEYLDEDDGTFRFTGLGFVIREDEEVEVQVAATIASNVDDAGTDASWQISVDEMRYFDADGVAEDDDDLDGVAGDDVRFDIVEEGDGEELKFSLGDGNPDATDILVDEDNTTDGVTVLEYTIEAEGGDIELNELWVRLNTGSATIANVVDDIEIEIDGDTFRNEATTTAGTQADYMFDVDGDVVVGEDEEVVVKVMVDFKSQDGNYSNGDTIRASVPSALVSLTDAEGADDVSEFSGSAAGDTHTLVAEGIIVPVDGVETSTDTSGQNDTVGEFTIDFEVTAVEGDFYIRELATGDADGITTATTGVEFMIEGGTATTSGTLSSTADEDTDGVFTVSEGETETFTLRVIVDPVSTGDFRVTLTGVNYSASTNGVTSTTLYTPTPAQDFRTSYESIQGS